MPDLFRRATVARLTQRVQRMRPGAFDVRVVGAPHDPTDTDLVADVALGPAHERRAHVAVACPVLAGGQRQRSVMPRSNGDAYCSSRRCRACDGIQSAPCSVNATRSSGKRSNTPPRIISYSGSPGPPHELELRDPHGVRAVALPRSAAGVERHRQPVIDAGGPERVVAGVVVRGQLEVAGRQHHARQARPRVARRRPSRQRRCRAAGRSPTPARRPGSCAQKSASHRLKIRGAGLTQLGVESGNGNAAPHGGSLLFWKSGEEHFGDDALPPPVARCARRSRRHPGDPRVAMASWPGVHVDHRLAEQAWTSSPSSGRPIERLRSRATPRVPRRSGRTRRAMLRIDVGPEVGDRRHRRDRRRRSRTRRSDIGCSIIGADGSGLLGT